MFSEQNQLQVIANPQTSTPVKTNRNDSMNTSQSHQRRELFAPLNCSQESKMQSTQWSSAEFPDFNSFFEEVIFGYLIS